MQSQESELTEAMGDKKSISSGHFQMPYDIVREGKMVLVYEVYSKL